jgi:hypothetical protein
MKCTCGCGEKKSRKEDVESLLAHEGPDLANLDIRRSMGMHVSRVFVEAACFGQIHIMELFLDKGLDLAGRWLRTGSD